MIKLNLVLQTCRFNDTDIVADKEKEFNTTNHRDSITSWPQSAGGAGALGGGSPGGPLRTIN